MENSHGQQGHSHHVVPLSVYINTFLLLGVLMVLTIVISFAHLGPLNNAVALTIAVVKATLVVLFFMNVRYSTRLVWLWAAAGFVWFLLMFMTFGDYLTRQVVSGW